ncbi:LOW QUALITY PROTEIN: hypothetical protein Cgig2_025592 [Carnegiea gigantea]|uniref:Uncharacterized protein n=1 Tax=Carnegiea gigantea TaxID=171969 RepID=A0A9Q1Q5L7_9CARY|nr:LOW QUALITY PROTEIN: hypothetical protein Cgig2_025592 [Carnegiea gigantea]
MKEEEPLMLQLAYETDSALSDGKDLWNVATKVVHPPVKENVLPLDRQKSSLDFFYLKDVPVAKYTPSRFHSSLVELMLLVRLLCFSSDFPDSSAHSFFMVREAAKVEKKMECRTLDIRSMEVPVPSPWTSISLGFEKVNVIHISRNTRSHENFSADLDSEITDPPPINNSGSVADYFKDIWPTSFLKEVSGDHLLLFPKRSDKNEAKFSEASKAAALTNRRRLCQPWSSFACL